MEQQLWVYFPNDPGPTITAHWLHVFSRLKTIGRLLYNLPMKSSSFSLNARVVRDDQSARRNTFSYFSFQLFEFGNEPLRLKSHASCCFTLIQLHSFARQMLFLSLQVYGIEKAHMAACFQRRRLVQRGPTLLELKF